MSDTTPAADTAVERPYLLERVDEAAVVQLYADGFAALPLREKTLVWHLVQAAIAGRDIYYDQRYAHNLEMRDTLEALVTHASGIDRSTRWRRGSRPKSAGRFKLRRTAHACRSTWANL